MRSTDFERLADLLAKTHRIKVLRSDKWAADIKERVVYYRGTDIYSLDDEQILGLTLHEIAHIHYTTETGPWDGDNKELTQSAMNMIEDIAIEHIIGGDYPNAKEILDDTREAVITKLLSMLPQLKDIPVQERAMLYGAALFHGRGYEQGRADYEITGEKIAKVLRQHQHEILSRKKTMDLKPIAEEIVKILTDDHGGITDHEKNQYNQANNKASQADLQNGRQRQLSRAVGSGMADAIKQRVINALGDESGEGWSAEGGNASNLGFIDEIADQSRDVGKKIRTTLKRNQAMEFAGRYRTGKLRPKSIKRIIVNKDEKPFQRRVIKSNQSYAFAVAADVSGSMSGAHPMSSDLSRAVTGLWMVGEALRLAMVERSLIIFGNNAVLLSPMSRKKIGWGRLADSDKHAMAGGGTDIGDAMQMCTQELTKSRAERKIMIILTDGGDDERRIKPFYDTARAQGIECVGIELGGGALKKLFKDKRCKVLNGSEKNKIGDAFIDILKETVKLDRGIA